MLLPLLRAELFKLSRRTMPRILLLILVLGVLALYLVLWLATQAETAGADAQSVEDLRDSLRVEEVRDSGLDLVRTLATILLVILGVTTITNEYSWGTIRTLLPRAGSRPAFLTAKLLLLLFAVVIAVVLGYAAALTASVVVSSAEGLGTDLGAGFLPHTLAALARTAFVMLPYVMLGFLVALWTRSTAAGIGIGLSVLFLEGLGVQVLNALGGRFARVPEVLLSENVAAVMRANRVAGGSLAEDTDLPSAWRGAVVLTAYIVAYVALAYRRFLTRDITSG